MRKALFFFLLLFSQIIVAQNLVLNPSLEDYRKLPQKLSSFKNSIKYWGTASNGSSDFFHMHGSKKVSIPKNKMGTQAAFEGLAYSGIYTYVERTQLNRSNAYREYIKGVLADTLKKDHWYRATFYVSLSDKSKYATKDFGILFCNQDFFIHKTSEIKVSDLIKKNSKLLHHYIFVESEQFYANTKDWKKISIEFKADGHEKFFAIGNFKNDKNTKILKVARFFKRKAAYYYIDHISIESLAVTPYSTRSINPKP